MAILISENYLGKERNQNVINVHHVIWDRLDSMGDVLLEHGNHFGHCHAIRGIGAFVIGLRSFRTWYLSLVSTYHTRKDHTCKRGSVIDSNRLVEEITNSRGAGY